MVSVLAPLIAEYPEPTPMYVLAFLSVSGTLISLLLEETLTKDNQVEF